MIKIYFESRTSSEHIASFAYEENYIRLLPTLELMAIEAGYDRVTEKEEEI